MFANKGARDQNTSGIKILRCPNCGSDIPVEDANKIAFTCPCCHATLINENNKFFNNFKANRVPRRFIPFSISKKDVENKFIAELVQKPEVPLDIFDVMKINAVDKYYLPMVSFEGVYEARGTISYRQKVGGKVDGKDASVVVNGTKSLVLSDNYNFLCSACAAQAPVPTDLLRFCDSRASMAKNFAKIDFSHEFTLEKLMAEDANLATVDPDYILDSNSVWHTTAVPIIKKMAEDDFAYEATKCNGTVGSVSTRIISNMEHNGTYVLVPFYNVSYSYQGVNYYYVIDGCGFGSDIWAPTDKNIKFTINMTLLFSVFSIFGGVLFAWFFADLADTAIGKTIYGTALFAFVALATAFLVRYKSFKRQCCKIKTERAQRFL